MKIRTVVFGVLLAALLAGVSTTFANPPDPVKVDIAVWPKTIHVGDTVEVQCEYIPLGGTPLWGLPYMEFPGNTGYPEIRYIRASRERGPFIWRLTLLPSVGEWEVSCGLWSDGVHVEYASTTYTVLP